MSEELKRGIPKPIVIGESVITKEEQQKNNEEFEKLLKKCGVLKENESIEDYIKNQKEDRT